MADRIEAIRAFRPTLKKGRTAGVKEASGLISGRTSVNEGATSQSLMEFKYVLTYLLGAGRALTLPGLGTFTPSINLDGKIKVNLKVDKELLGELNKPGGYQGDIINASNIGKSSVDLVALWDEANPGDIVV